MIKFKEIIKNNFLIIIIFLLAVLVKVFFIFRPFNFLLINFLSDDAFYYFVLAKNILAGLGSTFDGLNPDNGYHPLWLIILLPVFKLFKGVFTPLYAILAVCGFLNIITGYVILKIINRFSRSQIIKALVLGIWFLNPYNLYQNFNGLETSLSLLFIAIFILIIIKIKEINRIWLYAWSGIIGGLMILARLDNLMFFLLFLIWLFVSQKKIKYKKILLSGSIAFLIVLPWLTWNLLNFQTILPTSGKASTLVNHTLVVLDNGPALGQKIKATVSFTYSGILGVIRQSGAPEFFLIMFGLFLGLILYDKRLIDWQKIWREPLLYLFFGFCAIYVLNVSIRWTAREWYFVSFNIFLVIFLTWLLEKIKTQINHKKIVLSAVVLFFLFNFYYQFHNYLVNSMSQQTLMYSVTKWANKNLPPETKIGAFNSGIQGYFSTHRVINLDGLVNTNSYEALRQRRLWDYIKSEKIDYIIDYDIYLTYRYNSFWGIADPMQKLKLIENVSLGSNSGSNNGMNIYKIVY